MLNCDFTDENDIGGALGVPTANQGDIINGLLDINESGIVDSADDAPNINLFVLP